MVFRHVFVIEKRSGEVFVFGCVVDLKIAEASGYHIEPFALDVMVEPVVWVFWKVNVLFWFERDNSLVN